MKQPVGWRRVIAEGVVIVTGILLALAADAWWGGVQMAADERILAGNLAAEIDMAIAELDEALEIHSGLMCNADRWRRVTSSTPLDSAAAIVLGISAMRTPSLYLSTVSAVLASQELANIENDELRAWISNWPGVRADFEEELSGMLQFVRFVVPAYEVSAGIPVAALIRERANPLYPQDIVRRLIGDPGFMRLTEQAFDLHEVLVREGRLVRRVLIKGAELAGHHHPASAALETAQYEGEFHPSEESQRAYSIPGNLSITVFAERGGLMMRGPTGSLVPLTPSDENTFYAGAMDRIGFELADDGVARLSFGFACDPPGTSLGTWLRVR